MMSSIFDLIHQQLEKGLYHGASLALFQSGKWQEYYLGTIDGTQPVREGLVYDLASVSKVLGVGTLCIFLVNSGALELDMPLTHYYPSFKDRYVTVRQLLTHTSGIDPFIPDRNSLGAQQLKEAMNHLRVEEDKSFKYTDVNFILLGFMLEEMFGQSLDLLFEDVIFTPFGMRETSYGPRKGAVPTLRGLLDGLVHDPKARVLKEHTGSAGLFSTLKDLELFVDHYLKNDFSDNLFQNYSQIDKERSLAWDLKGDWIDHTGYTGPFIMLNKKAQKAAIFLTNRTYERDERSLWISERSQLTNLIGQVLEES
ncbi:serine hydrolase domain-containing protein [Streptococcus didelphis]|uniref:serine hydrolase domain-containing protein n=1 Tax=Streptococcus didelphis TaxID=102886 RepID=UPI000365F37F